MDFIKGLNIVSDQQGSNHVLYNDEFYHIKSFNSDQIVLENDESKSVLTLTDNLKSEIKKMKVIPELRDGMDTYFPFSVFEVKKFDVIAKMEANQIFPTENGLYLYEDTINSVMYIYNDRFPSDKNFFQTPLEYIKLLG